MSSLDGAMVGVVVEVIVSLLLVSLDGAKVVRLRSWSTVILTRLGARVGTPVVVVLLSSTNKGAAVGAVVVVLLLLSSSVDKGAAVGEEVGAVVVAL